MCFFWLEWWDLKVTLWRKVYVVHILEQNLYCFCSFEENSTLIFESEENVCLASAFSQKWAQSICLLSSFQKLVKQNIIPHISQTLDTIWTYLEVRSCLKFQLFACEMKWVPTKCTKPSESIQNWVGKQCHICCSILYDVWKLTSSAGNLCYSNSHHAIARWPSKEVFLNAECTSLVLH